MNTITIKHADEIMTLDDFHVVNGHCIVSKDGGWLVTNPEGAAVAFEHNLEDAMEAAEMDLVVQ